MHDRLTAPSGKIDLSRAKLCLILNNKAGKKDAAAQVDRISTILGPRVGNLTLRQIRDGRDIAQAARNAVADGADIVAGLGGDGTQAAIAGAVVNSGAAMAVLPGGTFNYFARELGLETLDQALAAVVDGTIVVRDVGQVNDRIFLNNASIGLYPHILRNREDVYRRWGRSRIAAYWSVLLGLRDMRRPMRLTVNLRGETRHFVTPMAFVARSAFQLDTLGLTGAEAVRQGQFALFVARGQSRIDIAAAALRLALGWTARGTDFDMVLADGFQIETDARQKRVALDGEQDKMAVPLRMQVLSGALRVFAPQGWHGQEGQG